MARSLDAHPLDIPAELQTRLVAAASDAALAPIPAQVSRITFGTAGWTDPSLLAPGLFYPRGIKSSSERLNYYASQFSMVELDSTFYALPSLETVERWAASTPAGFRMHVKAHPVLTGHDLDIARLPSELRAEFAPRREGRVRFHDAPTQLVNELRRRFFALLEPMASSGKLGAVLLQFPPWFTATRGGARQIEALAELGQTAGITFSVEFRHPSWFVDGRAERVLDLLRRNQLVHVVVDEPRGRVGGVPVVPEVTHPGLSLVRMHGRNVTGWRPGAAVAERFLWVYSQDELKEWVPRVLRLAEQAERVDVVFNNCVRNFAVLGAKGMARLVEATTQGNSAK